MTLRTPPGAGSSLRGGDEALRGEVTDALVGLGVGAVSDGERIVIDGVVFDLPLVERSHPHVGTVSELVARAGGPALLVADRISESARQALRDSGWSFLDRRGHLRVWVPGMRIDSPVGLRGDQARGNRSSPWTTVGFEVALQVLIHPNTEARARRIAAALGRSAGGTQEILNRFATEGLIGRNSHLPVLPDLFWETASRWPEDNWTALAAPAPEVAAGVPLGAMVRVDERAATLGGARIPAAADLPARFYVSKGDLRRLRHLSDRQRPARTYVRTSPVLWLPELVGFEPDAAHPWRVAHPMLCALRLGAEGSRGREIVEDWGIVPS